MEHDHSKHMLSHPKIAMLKHLDFALLLCGVASLALVAYHQSKLIQMLQREFETWALSPFVIFAKNLSEECRVQRRKLIYAWVAFVVFWILAVVAHNPG